MNYYQNEDPNQQVIKKEKKGMKINPVMTLIIALVAMGGGGAMTGFAFYSVFESQKLGFIAMVFGGFLIFVFGLVCLVMTIFGFKMISMNKKIQKAMQENQNAGIYSEEVASPQVPGKVRCSKCLTLNDGDARFCDQCGSELKRVCSRCGADNATNVHYCTKCGNKLS